LTAKVRAPAAISVTGASPDSRFSHAQSLIAARTIAKAPNDGYTLLVGSNTTHSANPYLVKDMGYDPAKDFVPITLWTINPLLLVVNAELPVRTVPEFVKYAKERPGKLNYGIGNTCGLVALQMLKSLTAIDAHEAGGNRRRRGAPRVHDHRSGRRQAVRPGGQVAHPRDHVEAASLDISGCRAARGVGAARIRLCFVGRRVRAGWGAAGRAAEDQPGVRESAGRTGH
jgi:hypothetical protein